MDTTSKLIKMAYLRDSSSNRLGQGSELPSLQRSSGQEDREDIRLGHAFLFYKHHKYRQDTETSGRLSREDSNSLVHKLHLFQDCPANIGFLCHM